MKLASGGIFRRLEPANLLAVHGPVFEPDFTCESPDVMLVRHEDVVFTSAGEIFRNGDMLPVFFPANDYGRRPDAAWYRRRLARAEKDAVSYAGEYLWITDRFSQNYYHWLCDCLPRLEAWLGHHATGRLLLPRSVHNLAYVRQSLMAYPEIEIAAPAPPGRGGRVETLLVPDPAAANGNHHEELAGKVARRLLRHFAADVEPSPQVRLHVTRIAAGKRHLSNEAALASVFTRHGFKPAIMERLDLAAQIRLAASARFMAGVHGAGLANMTFMAPGGAVLELRQMAGQPNSFFTLAAARRQSYFYVACKAADPASAVHAADLLCDPAELERALAQMRARRGLK